MDKLDPLVDALGRLRSPIAEVRQQAVDNLAALADRRALPALELMALNDRDSVSVEGAFVDKAEPIYADAVEALRTLYGRLGLLPEDIARVTALLNAPSNYANDEYHLFLLGGEALRPALREALASPDSRVALRAAATLARMHDPWSGIAQLSHPDPRVRSAAVDLADQKVWGPSWMAWPREAWRDALVARMSIEPEPDVRKRLIELLVLYGTNHPQYGLDDPATMLLLLQRRQDPDVRVRALAAQRLQQFRWQAFGVALPRLAEEALAWARAEVDPAIVRCLVLSAPLLPFEPAATEWLLSQLHSDDHQLRGLAASTLQYGDPGLVAGPLLDAADSQNQELRRAALLSLAYIGDTRALPKFERELANAVMDSGEKHNLSQWFRRLKRRGGTSRRRKA